MTEAGSVRRHVLAVVIVLGLVAAAAAAGVLWNRPPGDLAGDWLATSVELDGASILEPTDSSLPRLTIEDDDSGLAADATAGCNTIGAPVTYRIGGSLRFDELITTDIGCPERLADLESALAQALARVDHVEVDGDELELTGDGVEMSFTRLAA
jgi:heat shock protein HslJ